VKADKVKLAFQSMGSIIQGAALSKTPATWPNDGMNYPPVNSIREAIEKITEIKQNRKATPTQLSHLACVADGVPALGWILVAPKPTPYIVEMKDAAQFYGNRVLRDFKDKEPIHVQWVKAWIGTLLDLSEYVKEWHTTGLVFNSLKTSSEFSSCLGNGLSNATKGAAPAPPSAPGPPPPPPPPKFDGPATHTAAPAGDMSSVFSQLNVGSSVTSGLRKVDNSQMTHKNPSLRASGVIKATDSPSKPENSVTADVKKKKLEPKMTLEGNKWIIENFENKHDIRVTDVSLKTVVYLYGCSNCTIQVDGKINSFAVDNCKKVGVVIDSVVSTLDIVNGKGIQIQVNGHISTIAVDNSDGVTLFLSEKAFEAEILTAKSTEVNVMIPAAKEGGDMRELPIPEQFKTKFNRTSGQLQTVPVEHSGA
jgi:adenylyl cyclase-associated protein